MSNDKRKEARQRRKELMHKLNITRHHVLFEEYIWSLSAYAELRTDRYLVLPMDNQLHGELHEAIPPIPPLGRNLMKYVRCRYKYAISKKFPCELKVEDKIIAPTGGIEALIESLEFVKTLGSVTQLEKDQIGLMKKNLNLQKEVILRSNKIIADKQWALVQGIVLLQEEVENNNDDETDIVSRATQRCAAGGYHV